MINRTNVVKHSPLMALIKSRASVEQLAMMAGARVPDVTWLRRVIDDIVARPKVTHIFTRVLTPRSQGGIF